MPDAQISRSIEDQQLSERLIAHARKAAVEGELVEHYQIEQETGSLAKVAEAGAEDILHTTLDQLLLPHSSIQHICKDIRAHPSREDADIRRRMQDNRPTLPTISIFESFYSKAPAARAGNHFVVIPLPSFLTHSW